MEGLDRPERGPPPALEANKHLGDNRKSFWVMILVTEPVGVVVAVGESRSSGRAAAMVFYNLQAGKKMNFIKGVSLILKFDTFNSFMFPLVGFVEK